jgi:multidrug efflux pump subunit AcrA (membrane-fusion protein)
MSGRSRLISIGLPIAGLCALAGGVWLVATNRPSVVSEPSPRRPVTQPVADKVADTISPAGGGGLIGAVGISEPPGEPIAIAAHVAGIVQSVEATVGADVRRGDVLFRVDDRRAAAELAARQCQIDAAVADMEALRATVPTREAAIASARAAQASAEARVLEAEADLADRRNKLQLGERLLRTAVVSSEEVDNRRFIMQQAEARVATARAAVAEAAAGVVQAQAELARLVSPVGGGPGPDIIAAEKRIALAQRESDKATTELEQFSVRSPVDGRIIQINIRPGEFAPASVPAEGLVVIGRKGPTHLRVEIDEVDMPRFRAELPAWASPRGSVGIRYPLSIAYVEPLVVPKRGLSGRTTDIVDTRVLQVVYTLNDEEPNLGIGQQYDVFITPATIGETADGQ